MSTDGDAQCRTQTLFFPPRFYQQVLKWSEHRVLGSAPDSRTTVKAPFGRILKGKIPPALPGRERVPAGSGNTRVFNKLQIFQPLQPATPSSSRAASGSPPGQGDMKPRDALGATGHSTSGTATVPNRLCSDKMGSSSQS